jgi:anti-anti-sigma factor
VVVVAGVVDLSTVERFGEALDAALDSQPGAVVVDLDGVSLLDSTGIATLVHAHNRAMAATVSLTVVNLQPIVRRVLDITGVLHALTGEAPPATP